MAYSTLASLLTLALLTLNLRLHLPRAAEYGTARVPPDTVAQLRFGKQQLEGDAAERMQRLFPEGYFFSYALYGLTWVEVGLREPEGSAARAEALREARWALAQLDSPAGRAPFSPTLEPPHGVFYVGWSSWLRGGVLRLQPPTARNPDEVARFEADCAALAAAFDRSPTPFLTAYPGQAWPVDSVVAVAALSLRDRLLPPRYGETIARWQAGAQARLDPATALLPHRAHPTTGEPLEGARGSSGSIMARFLVEIDEPWGREQYARFREGFVTTRLGVPGVQEFPRGVAGAGDVDSGPLVAGVSLSATVVTLGAALAHGDRALADPLLHAGEALGLPVSWGGAKRYAFGLLPAGDAFLAWAKSAPPSNPDGAPAPLPPVAPAWWRLPWHGASLGLAAALWLPLRKRRR